MAKMIVMTVCFAAASTAMGTHLPQPVGLDTLTPPTWHLRLGCVLSSAPSMRVEGGKVLSGRWGGLSVTANPWTGTDRRIIASIREHMYGLPRGSDGPPFAGSESTRYFLKFADGVDEGYAAFYEKPEARSITAYVYALRFAAAEKIPARPVNTQSSSERIVSWFELGQIVGFVVGDVGSCTQAIDTYLRSLSKKD